MKKIVLLSLLLVLVASTTFAQNPVADLVNRIHKGSSSKFTFQITDAQSEEDFFELSSKGKKIVISGNNWISVAAGLNWYLKYHAGVQIAWNNPRANLNISLPKLKSSERHSTKQLLRYYLNYCTVSYSMAFWGWERWQQEIDWMALHGVNMPLAVIGTCTVWRNVMLEIGYAQSEVNRFVAGPGFQAWWLMNNLEGWGGENPNSYYENQAKLEQRIVKEYKTWGIEPVYAGYAGMIPSFEPVDSSAKFDFTLQNPGLWCGYQRPAFLQPSDNNFDKIATLYYMELEKLYGKAKYYAIDPFHEGGSTKGVDLSQAGRALFDQMRKASPGSVWVIQSWQAAPYPKLIGDLPLSGVIVLDLQSEERPQWGDPKSVWFRKDGFQGHDWIYCMLLNFGGNIGSYGRMSRVIDGFYNAKESTFGKTMLGVGTTMEGVENNPVMYELLYELPWRSERFTKSQWIENWVKARYGRTLPQTIEAWKVLSNTAYDNLNDSPREGTPESVFCARPALEVPRVSSWGGADIFYDTKEFEKALTLMVSVGEKYRGCNNFQYDIVDVARQALANRANEMLPAMNDAFTEGNKTKFNKLATIFLEMILLQDKLLNSRTEFMVGPWIEMASKMGSSSAESEFYVWNARTLITTWGNRKAANQGGLHDYSHREWGGLMKDYYYPRWKFLFDYIDKNEMLPIGFDYYDMEEKWAMGTNLYPTTPQSDEIDMACEVNDFLKQK